MRSELRTNGSPLNRFLQINTRSENLKLAVDCLKGLVHSEIQSAVHLLPFKQSKIQMPFSFFSWADIRWHLANTKCMSTVLEWCILILRFVCKLFIYLFWSQSNGCGSWWYIEVLWIHFCLPVAFNLPLINHQGPQFQPQIFNALLRKRKSYLYLRWSENQKMNRKCFSELPLYQYQPPQLVSCVYIISFVVLWSSILYC